MRYRVIIAPEAESDLRKAGSYIRRDNPRAARACLPFDHEEPLLQEF